MNTESSRLAPSTRAALPLLGLLGLTFVAYVPAMSCGYIWDDDDYVTENETLRTVDGIRRIWFEKNALPQYYPLVHTTYWIEYRFWQLRPAGYHVTNVLLHAIGAILVWRVLTKLQVPGAWIAAAIFAVHPVHVESVAWITERKNTLSGVFYLSAALAFLHFYRVNDDAPERRRWIFYLLSIGFFICSLMSKTVTVTLPAAILLMIWFRRDRIGWRDVALVTPMILLAIPAALNTVAVETHHVGTKYIDWDLSPIDRCLIAGRALWFYAGKLVWPSTLTFIYPRWEINDAVWWQYIFPLAFFVIAGLLWRRRDKNGRGPLAAILFFAGTLAPALGFVNVYPMRFSFVADHFQYLASIGIIATVAAIVATKWMPRESAKPHWSHFAVAAVVGLLCVLTWFQCHIYKDEIALWTDTINKNPSAQIAYTNLGVKLTKDGNPRMALHPLTKAIELKPDEDPDAYANRGLAREALGEFEGAIEDYTRAIQIGTTDIRVYQWRGRAHAWLWHLDLPLSDRRRHARASITDFDYVISHNSDDALIFISRGMSRVMLGQPNDALADGDRAARIDPALPKILLLRGMAKLLQNETESGQRDLARYLQIHPEQKSFVEQTVNRIREDFSQ